MREFALSECEDEGLKLYLREFALSECEDEGQKCHLREFALIERMRDENSI